METWSTDFGPLLETNYSQINRRESNRNYSRTVVSVRTYVQKELLDI